MTLRAELEGSVVHRFNGDTRVLDRFSGNGKIRGFEPNGIGPRDLGAVNGALGGNYFTSRGSSRSSRWGCRPSMAFPAVFSPMSGRSGALTTRRGLAVTIDDSFNLRSSVGVSIFWNTAIGPLRFNFSKAIQKESYDREQTFDLTVSTQF